MTVISRRPTPDDAGTAKGYISRQRGGKPNYREHDMGPATARAPRPGHSVGSRLEQKVRSFVLLAGILCCLVAAALLGARLAPYHVWARYGRMASGATWLDGSAHAAFLPRLALGAAVYGVMGILMLRERPRLSRALALALESVADYCRQCCAAAGRDIAGQSRSHIAALAVAVAAGAALRIFYLPEPPRFDESYTYVGFAGRSIFHVLALYTEPNNHVFHSLLAWLSCRIFGNSVYALRLPVLLAGTILIPLMYTTARRLAGAHAGLLAAVFAAFSGPLILYSCNARGYMLQAVLFVVMLNLAIDIAAKASPGPWLLFTIAASLGFWVTPTMLYPYLAVCGWLLWIGGLRLAPRVAISGVVSAILSVALYTPILLVSGPEALLHNRWTRPLDSAEFWLEARRFPEDLARFLHGGDPLWIAGLFAAGIVACAAVRRPGIRDAWRLFCVACMVIVSVPLVHRVVPFPRILIPLLCAYYLTAASGLASVLDACRARGAAVVAAALTVLCAGGWSFTRSPYMQEHREYPEARAVAAYLAGEFTSCDALLVSPSAGPAVEYELRRLHRKYKWFSNRDPLPQRVLIAARRIDGPLPPRGNGLADPSGLTLSGTLRDFKVPVAAFTPARVIYQTGPAVVYELTRLGQRAPGPQCARL